MNTPGIEAYRALERDLLRIRARYGGEESHDEIIHLSQMDEVWEQLTDRERQALNMERDLPQAIREMRSHDMLGPMVDTNIWLPRRSSVPVRRGRTLACT